MLQNKAAYGQGNRGLDCLMKSYFFKKFIQFKIFLIFIAVGTLPAFADGIYVTKDLKHVVEDHTVIRLDKKQIKDVERLREVVLTEEQIKPLKAIYGNVPHKLSVLSSRWDSCTCDLGVYAIWCRVGEIDIPHSSLEGQKMLDEYYEKNPPSKTEATKTTNESSKYAFIGKSLILDSQGNMYLDGKEIAEGELLSMVDDISKQQVPGKEATRYIYLDIPPPINEAIDEKIFNLTERIEAHCVKSNVEFWALGISLEKMKRRENKLIE